jgi:hypothetical protein
LIAFAARAAASPIEQGAPDIAIDDDPFEELPGAELDDEPPRTASDASAALIEDAFAPITGITDVELVHDAQLRHQQPPAWGRIDLSLAWRSTERDLHRDDEVWLVATWRR